MNTLVIQPVGGLCNRLRFLFSMIRYLIDNNKFKTTKLIVIWIAAENCNGWIQDFIKPMKTVIFKKFNPNQNIKVDIRSSGIVEGYHNLNYVLRVPINLNNQIRKKIKAIIKDKLNDKYIAVHIRRTDHYENLKKSKNSERIHQFKTNSKRFQKKIKNLSTNS